MRVAVLMGGRSREREISLKTGRAIASALRSLGHETVEIDPGIGAAAEILDAAVDVVFIALHGRYGEDGTIQGLLEYMEIPYTGSGVLASAAAMDKVFSKRLFEMSGIPTPRFQVAERGREVTVGAGLSFPLVVKPSLEGSSLGMTIAGNTAEIADALVTAYTHGPVAVVEEFVEGTEVTVGVLGNDAPRPLPPLEVAPRSGTYDYYSKYTPGATEYIIPPRLPKGTISDCSDLGLQAHKALGCAGFSRVDIMVGPEGPEVIEVNTIPGMTETSLLPKAAAAAGIDFPDLVDTILRYACE